MSTPETGRRRPRPETATSTAPATVSADGSAVAPAGGSESSAAAAAPAPGQPRLSVFFSDDLAVPEVKKNPTGRKSPFELDAMPKGSHFLLLPEHEATVRRAASAANKRYAVPDPSGATRDHKVKAEDGTVTTEQRPKLVAERHYDVYLLPPEQVETISTERLVKAFGEDFKREDLKGLFACFRTV